MEDNLTVMNEMSENGTEDPRLYLNGLNKRYYLVTLAATVKILNKVGYNTTWNDTYSFNWALNAEQLVESKEK